jgi:hypothetical protein
MQNVAQRVIEKVGGHDVAADLAQVSVTSTYRWTYPKSKGGTGGLIPARHQGPLLRRARERGLPLTADDFIPTDAAE